MHDFILDDDFEYLVNLDFESGFKTICQDSHQRNSIKSCQLYDMSPFFSPQNPSLCTSHTYRIKSCQLYDIFPIPSPQNPSLCIAIEFVLPDYDLKLVSVHKEEENKVCYEVLTLNIAQLNTSLRWRPINIPSSKQQQQYYYMRQNTNNNIQIFFKMGFAYCISIFGDLDIEIDVLDMVNESYIGHTTFPRQTFFSNNPPLHLLNWNGHLSFAQLVNDDELHVLVLNHPTKLEWAGKKRIIKLPFLTEDLNKKKLITFHACVNKSLLLFLWHDNKHLSKKILNYYDICTGKLRT